MSLDIAAPAVDNPYLDGVLAPVHSEVTAFDLPVTGTIPEHLDGRYLRNGPNPAAEVDPAVYHWFAGDAMVHGLSLRDGAAAWYRNRWVRTPAVSATLGEPRVRDLDARAGMLSVGPNTSVIEHAGQTCALVEGGGANYRLTEELDTLGTCDFDGTLYGGYTAHPHRDPRTGELHAVSYSLNRGRFVQYSVIGTDGRARRTVDIPVTGSPIMHDFSLTEKYVVVFDLPLTFDIKELVPMVVPRGLRLPARLVMQSFLGKVALPGPVQARVNARSGRTDTMPFSWDPSYPARVGVLAREADGNGADAPIRWFDIDPCYVFHPLNAYTEDRDGREILTIDLVRYDKMFDRDHRGPSEGDPRLERWEIDLTTGAVRTEVRDDRAQEFPRINETLTGSRHRYGYTLGLDGFGEGAINGSRLYKHDYDTGAITAAKTDPELVLGEMCFVPDPDGNAEDDGVLMGLGQHRGRDEGQLVILDAPTLETVATVSLPQRIPLGFHGNWCPRAR
ncbi:MAG: carotenoid oxygenase family protein [Mycolicibacterium sp.]|nr:carotenoid oxygenase family protein [Mycolicibacterium sp.]